MKHLVNFITYILEGNKYSGKNIEDFLNDFNRLYSNSTFIFFDTETSGFHRRADQLLEIAAIATDSSFNELDSFREKIKLHPETLNRPRAKAAFTLNRYGEKGISYNDENETIEQFLNWINYFNDPVLVAQNANFDIKFLARYNSKLPTYPVIDTFDILKKIFIPALIVAAEIDDNENAIKILSSLPKSNRTGLYSASLGNVAKSMNINAAGWHRADQDVLIMIDILKSILDFLEDYKYLDIREPQSKYIAMDRNFNIKKRKNRSKNRYSD